MLLRNIFPLRAPETEQGATPPKAGPESRPTDEHTASVGDALNQAAAADESGLHVADQPPTTEKILKGFGSDQEDVSQEELDVRELLTFDPFAEDEQPHPESKRKAKSPAETPPDGKGTALQPDKTGEQAKGTEQGAKPPQADELAQLRVQLAEAQRTIATLAQRQAQPQAQPAAQSEEVEGQERQRLEGMYNWQVPPQLAEALGSENVVERQTALAALFNSAARETHFRVLKDMREAMEHLVGQLPQIVTSHVQQHTTQTDLAQDLYGAHPDLNKPFIRKLVPEVAKVVTREMGATQWSAQVRDAVAKRVRDELGLTQPQVQAQAAPAAPNGQAGTVRPPTAFRSTVRNSPGGYASRVQEDIMNTLGLD